MGPANAVTLTQTAVWFWKAQALFSAAHREWMVKTKFMKVFHKNVVAIFPKAFMGSEVHIASIVYFTEHFWLDFFMVRFFCFLSGAWAACSVMERPRAQHRAGTLLTRSQLRGSSEGVQAAKCPTVFHSVLHQSQWCPLTLVCSWAHWRQWNLHRNFPGSTPIHCSEIRIWPSSFKPLILSIAIHDI